MIGPNGMNAACKIAVVTCSSRPPAREWKDRDEVRRWRAAGRDSWIDAGGFLGVQAVGGLLTHVERRLRLRHRPLSCSLRCPDWGGRGDGAREGAQKSWTGRLHEWLHARPVGQFLARKRPRRLFVASLRSRAVGPSDDELTDDGDVCPQVSGPAHADRRYLASEITPGARLDSPSRRNPFHPSPNVGSPPRPSVPRTGWLPASVSAPWRPRARVSPLRAPALWSSARRSPPPRPSWSSAKVRTAPAPR